MTVPKAAPPSLVISPPHSDLRLFHDPQLAIEDRVRQCIQQPRPDFQEVATSLVIDPKDNDARVRVGWVRAYGGEIQIQSDDGPMFPQAGPREIGIPRRTKSLVEYADGVMAGFTEQLRQLKRQVLV